MYEIGFYIFGAATIFLAACGYYLSTKLKETEKELKALKEEVEQDANN